VQLPERSTPTNADREPMSAAPILSRESRWLRLGGMALMVVATFGFAVLEDAADLRQLIRSADRSNLTSIAVGFVVIANLFTSGLVLLLVGLRQLSLRANAHARRGALARMGALNLSLLCFAFVALQESGALDDEFFTSWYVVPILVAFVVVARVSTLWFRSGWKHEALTAKEALASDPRPPVVYLRSFGVDNQFRVVTRGRRARLAASLNYAASVSPEQEMAFIMERVGPVVAIGKPGERLPELGAARLYVGDDQWRDVVGKFMNDAALVVIRAGETENLWWETEEALTRCAPERVIIVALGPPETRVAFERRFTETFGKPAEPPPAPRASALATFLRLMFPYGSSAGKIIYFDQHARPQEQPLLYRPTWSGLILSAYRPYRDSLQAAFKIVFAKLDLPWVSKRTLTTAVLLAFFGGIFGLHHFYMGRTRRGLWYLAFFWIAVPMLLGWIDAARLALLDEARFQARLKVDDLARSVK
jgi:TM2 domain-containing membrane protein YozV